MKGYTHDYLKRCMVSEDGVEQLVANLAVWYDPNTDRWLIECMLWDCDYCNPEPCMYSR